MSSKPIIEDEIQRIFEDALHMEPPARDEDLIAGGTLDSFAILELLAEVESRFRIEVPLDDLEVETVRTVDRIARLVERCVAARVNTVP